MSLLALPYRLLAFIGRHGTFAIALSLLVGMALPFLSASLRPFLDEAILTLLTLAFLRIGFRALITEIRAPAAVLFAVGIALLAFPAIAFLVAQAFNLHITQPDLYLALFIALAVPPITSVPIFASLLRLPGPIALLFLILMMVATPFVAVLHARLFFAEGTLPIDGVALGLRLAGFLFGAAALGALIRNLVGEERLAEHRAPFDGINVLAMFIFAVAVMDGVGPALIATPGLVFALLGATFALALVQMGLMRAALWFMDGQKALAIALATGLRNMGLMVAALGTAVPETTWLWFAMGQFPIFFMPWFIELARRARAPSLA